MSRVWCFVLFLFFSPFLSNAQKAGLAILKKPDWEKVLDVAREQKKIIFVDCGTAWCGPCKKFASEVLTDKNVRRFFNKNFINVYIDIEKDDMPPVASLPWLGSVPTFLFIDAFRKEVIHSHIGFLNAEALLDLATDVKMGKETIRVLKEQMNENGLSGRKLLMYIEKLKKGGYPFEARQYIPSYLSTLTVDSLKYEGNWKLCEDELNDVMSPLFQQIWERRDELCMWYNRERVMKKLLEVIELRLYNELNWIYQPEKFNDIDFENFVSFLLSVENENKDYYHLSIDAERLARRGCYENMLKTLRSVWKSSIQENQKKSMTRGFIRKMANNVSIEEIQTCVDFLEEIIANYGSAGTKGELLYLEAELWRMRGDQLKAQEVERRGVKLINPNYIFN